MLLSITSVGLIYSEFISFWWGEMSNRENVGWALVFALVAISKNGLAPTLLASLVSQIRPLRLTLHDWFRLPLLSGMPLRNPLLI